MRKTLPVLVLIILAIVAYNYIYKDHRDIASETPEHKLTSDILLNEFSTDVPNSEIKYLNKTIQVSGTISEIDGRSMVLNGAILCLFEKPISTQINVHSDVVVKGRYIGYDDLLEEIKLDQCNILTNP